LLSERICRGANWLTVSLSWGKCPDRIFRVAEDHVATPIDDQALVAVLEMTKHF
jgi:hypothetical protein